MRLKQSGLAIDAMSAFRQWHANDACLKTRQDLDTVVHLQFAFQHQSGHFPHSESWDFRQPPVATEGCVHAG